MKRRERCSVAGCVKDDASEVVGCGRQSSGAPELSMSYSLELVALLPSMAKGLCSCDSLKTLRWGSSWAGWVAPARSLGSLKESEEEM